MTKKFLTLFLFLALPVAALADDAATDGDDAGGGFEGGRLLVQGPGGSNGSGGASIHADEFTGAATYNIEMPVPPGINGLTPQLNLNYNSHRKNPNSWVGLGWELDLGSIQRTAMGGIIDYENGKAFEARLGGQSETLQLQEEDVDPSEYGLEPSDSGVDLYSAKIESSFNIYLHIRGEGWVVIDKSGRRFYFGETGAGRMEAGSGIAKWMLERVADANGNEMSVRYGSVFRLPYQVTYADIEITFEMDDDRPYFPLYRQGTLERTHVRSLKKITVRQRTGGSSVRIQKFTLEYERSLLLKKITRYGRDDAAVLPATTFTYHNMDPSEMAFDAASSRQASHFSGGDRVDGFLNEYSQTVDMNGDGLADHLVGLKDSGGFYVYYNNGTDFVETAHSVWEDPFHGCEDNLCRGKITASVPVNEGGIDGDTVDTIPSEWTFVMDMNGDALPDRVSKVKIGGVYHFRIFFNDGAAWSQEETWEDPYEGLYSGLISSRAGLIDMNGDGLVDRIARDAEAGGFNVYRGNGHDFDDEPVFWADPYEVYHPLPDEPVIGRSIEDDVGKIFAKDPDNKIHLMIRDLNGDGLPDRVIRAFGRRWNEDGSTDDVSQAGFLVFMNLNGKEWAQPVLRDRARTDDTSSPNDVYEYDSISRLFMPDPIEEEDKKGLIDSKHDLIDMNLDGFADRVIGKDGEIKIYLFKGLAPGQAFEYFDSNPIILTDPANDDGWDARGCLSCSKAEGMHTFLRDLNGDGYPDRVTITPRNGDNDDKDFMVYRLLMNPLPMSFSERIGINFNQPAMALKSADDGIGNITEIEYIPSSRTMQSQRFLPFTLYLAHKIYVSDYMMPSAPGYSEAARHPGMRWTTYDYSGGNFYVRYATDTSSHEAQFNGFQKVTHTLFKAPGETWRPFTTTTFYHQSRGEAFSQALSSGLEPEGYGHFALSGKPYKQVINETSGARITETSDWSLNAAEDDNYLCSGTCFPKLRERQKTVLETPTATPRVSRIAYDYDELGNITSEINYAADGSEILTKTTSYHPRGDFDVNLCIRDRPAIQTQQKGEEVFRKKIFNYDSKGNPTEEKFLVSSSPERYAAITRTFYPNGNLHAITDIDGITKSLGYDDQWLFPVWERLIHGGVTLATERQFDRLTGEITSEIGPNGVGRRTEFDDFGRPLREIIRAADGAETVAKEYNYEYTDTVPFATGITKFLKISVWDRQSGYSDTLTTPAQISHADPSGNVVQQCSRRPDGRTSRVRKKLTQAGREEEQTEPEIYGECPQPGIFSGRAHRVKKDLQGRTTFLDPPSGDTDSPLGSVSIAYSTNSDGYLVRNSVFANGQTKQEIFNDTERVERVSDSNSSPLRYDYNAAGDLRHVYGIGDELLTTIEYDLLGRKVSMIDSDMGTWSYQYDDYGRLEWQTDTKNQKVHYFYTSLGRVQRKEYLKADGSLEKYEVYSYDSGDSEHDVRPGELFKVREYNVEEGGSPRNTRFGYDPLYRRVSKITRHINGIGDFEQTLAYDAKGLLQNTTYPSGTTLYHQYARTGILKNICEHESCDPSLGEVYYSINPDNAFDSFGNLQKETYGNGVIADYQYYPGSHRLYEKKLTKGTAVYSQRTYTYDEHSNILSIGEPRLGVQGSGAVSAIGYDSLNRLTSYTPSGGAAVLLDYDLRGNLKKNTASHGDDEYIYDLPAHPHAVSRIGEASFAYDDNGNMISDPGRQMTYNAQNQLVHVAMGNGVTVDYDYDYTGARVSKKVRREDPLHRIHEATTHFLGEALEIKGNRLILHISGGGQKIATKTLGAMSDIMGPAAGSLRQTGIIPNWNPFMLAPFLLLFFTLFVIASFRPVRHLIIFPSFSPLPLWLRVSAVGGRVRGWLD
ncbi:MAG: SpvB/TcaC N-terminal domain-containing protein, partial [Deltaproteobacteria bacterium]|nr:SpvB/TcaC N-terminal domain-containing protein [Deltaproteobacteria bacterium]